MLQCMNVAWVKGGVGGSSKDTENILCIKNNSYKNFIFQLNQISSDE